MNHRTLVLPLIVGALAACQPYLPFGGEAATGDDAPRASERARPAAQAAREADGAGADLAALARRPAGEESVCRTFARHIAEAALRHDDDVEAFMGVLQDEFVGGKENPFDLRDGLDEGTWNQRYFYAGHGGFRDDYDDADRYPDGGNHQPGHFVSVLTIAQRFGEEQARVAIAFAGDYEPGEEDDLRLSMVAIELGAGLTAGTVTPAMVAQRARELCRT